MRKNGRVLGGGVMGFESGRACANGACLAVALLASTTIADASASGFSDIAPMSDARASATATRLPSDRVLVTGGQAPTGATLKSAEIYDPAAQTWTSVPQMDFPRQNHTATLLADGNVLVTGWSGTSQLFDETSGAWLPAAWPEENHTQNTASLLASGRVLVYGAGNPNAEVYDPTQNAWSPAVAPFSREGHSASVLASGKVLIAGGDDLFHISSSALVYDPVTNAWTMAPPLAVARVRHTATMLASGKVLVAGGVGSGGPDDYLPSTEIYDPSSNSWTAGPDMTQGRAYAAATLLPSGQVLVAGGLTSGATPTDSAEIYDAVSNSWTPVESMHAVRFRHTATLLSSGQVLIAGGDDAGYVALATAEIYTPPTWITIDASTPEPSVTQAPYQVSFSVHDFAGTPTGSVVLADDAGTSCGPVVLANGAGTCTLYSFTAGTHALTATYTPDDGAFTPATATASHEVDRAATSLTLSIPSDPSDPDQVLWVHAFVDVTAPGNGSPGGTIVVQRDDGASCTIDVQSMIDCAMPPAAVGTHVVEATYAGDDNYLGSDASASYLVYAFETMTFVTGASPEPSQVGQEVSVAFAVSGPGAPPTGTVTVVAEFTGETCTADVAVGACTLVFHGDGPRGLTASYSGDATHLPSDSVPVTHDVVEADTSVAITSHTPDPSLPFEAVTVSAVLTVLPPGSGSPHGSLFVGDGVDTCEIPEGGTSCDLVLSTRGPRTITATYGGDGDFNPSSDQVTHHVNRLPIVADANYATLEETPLTVGAAEGVLAGASDPDGDPLVIANPGTFEGNNLHGTVELHADGSFVYTPPPGLSGTDQFGFIVSDGYETVGATATIVVGASANLSIAIDDGTAFATGGATVQYTIIVANGGPSAVTGAHVEDPLPANLSGVIWTCAASAGASCTAAGSDGIDDVVDVPVGATLTYVMTGTVAAAPEVPLANTASVHAPAGTADTNPLDDSATDLDAVGVFADGFDTAETGREVSAARE